MERYLIILIMFIVITHGDRALVKIGVSKTTIPPVVTTETSTTTPTSTTTTSSSTLAVNSTEKLTTIPSTTTSTTTSAPPGNITEAPETKNQTGNSTEVTKVPRRLRLHQAENYFCKCDLKINVCDVDCCCDIDCTGEMLSVFDCHESYISSEDYHALHGLPSCKISSSIFCVLKNNLRRYEFEEFDETLASRKIHKWPDFLQESPVESTWENYRLHDSIEIFTEVGEKELKIPLSISGAICHVEESVKFLKNSHSICLRGPTDSFPIEYLTRLSTVEIPPKPKIPCVDVSNSCLTVEILRCRNGKNLHNCRTWNVTESPDSFSFDLTLRFTHNFTILVKIEAFAIEKLHLEMGKSYQQVIDVVFTTINESQSHTVSGNIGYLPGKPIIFTHIHSVNVSEDKQQSIIDYFHPNRTSEDEDYHMNLPGSIGGICISRNFSREILNFGENQVKTCEIHLLDSLNVTQETNFTEICREFHKKILLHLLMFPNATQSIPFEELFVSEFGNPRNDTSNWIQLDVKGISESSSVEGIFDSVDETITCRNMVIRVKHLYQFARLEVAGNRHQALIERASIDFGPRVDLQFKISEDFRVPIFHVISFIDLTHRVRSSSSILTISSPLFGIGLLVRALVNLSST